MGRGERRKLLVPSPLPVGDRSIPSLQRKEGNHCPGNAKPEPEDWLAIGERVGGGDAVLKHFGLI